MNQRTAAANARGAGVLLEPGVIGQVRLAWRLFRDPRVAPRLKMIVPVLTAAYVLSPIDLVPDFLLGLGQVDDVGAIGLALLVLTRLVPRLAPAEVVAEHRAAMGLGGAPRGTGGDRERTVVEATYRVRDATERGPG